MAGSSNNPGNRPFGQEIYDQLFGAGEEMPNLNVLAHYVRSNVAPEEMTDSQPDETQPDSQFIPNTGYESPPPPAYFVHSPSPSHHDSPSLGPVPSGSEEPGPSSSRGKKKKTTSDVWNDFELSFTYNDDGTKDRWGTCRLCRKKFCATSRSHGTAQLKRHIISCRKRMEEIANLTTASSAPHTVPVQPIPGQVSDLNSTIVREAVAKVIVGLELPISVGANPFFEDFVKVFYPTYQACSRGTIRSDILKLFRKKQLELQDEFRRGTFNVALTSDVWSGRAKQDYVSVVAHYVDGDWNLQKRIIGFPLLDVRHSGQNISERVMNVLVNWDLHKRIISVTLDNATSNNVAIELMRPSLTGLHEDLFHVRCADHIINLIVKEGISLLGDSIHKVRETIVYLSGSSQRVASFKISCRAYGLRPRKFHTDEPHRWNSTFLMLQEVIPYKEVLSMWINKEWGGSYITEEDWTIAHVLLEFLDVFYQATLCFSTIYTPSTNVALHQLFNISECFNKYRSHELIGPIIFPMEAKFMKYFRKIPLLYLIGVMLDPRVKLYRLQYILECFSSNMNYDFVGTQLKDAEDSFRRLYRAYEEEYRTQHAEDLSPARSPVRSNFVSPVKKAFAAYEVHMRARAEEAGSFFSPEGSQGDEVDRYFTTKLVSTKIENLDILKWWRNVSVDFPILSLLARDVLSIPVSTISSESAFSLSGRILDNRRMSLTPEMVECLTCLKDWELAFRRDQYQIRNPDDMCDYFSNLYVDSDASGSSRQ